MSLYDKRELKKYGMSHIYPEKELKKSIQELKEGVSEIIDNIKKNGKESSRLSCLNSAYAEIINKIENVFGKELTQTLDSTSGGEDGR